MVMREYDFDQDTAFARLRKHARDRSRKLEEIAGEIIASGVCPPL
jgi:AmiR/NasT family two-component response regulator